MACSKITLRCSDGKEIEVDGRMALSSRKIRRWKDQNLTHFPIPLPNINSNVLSKVIEYCYMHVAEAVDEQQQQLRSWDAEFIKESDKDVLFSLLTAANDLEIKGLVDLTCGTMKDLYKIEREQSDRKKRALVAFYCFFGLLLFLILCFVIMLIYVFYKQMKS